MNTEREIHTRDELLACLREEPMRRIVKYVHDELAVIQYPQMYRVGEHRPDGEVVAVIGLHGSATTLLNDICSIEGCAEWWPNARLLTEIVKKLPIRCMPDDGDQWCLPEYLQEYTKGWSRDNSHAVPDGWDLWCEPIEIQSCDALLAVLANPVGLSPQLIRGELTIVLQREDGPAIELATIVPQSDAWKLLFGSESSEQGRVLSEFVGSYLDKQKETTP